VSNISCCIREQRPLSWPKYIWAPKPAHNDTKKTVASITTEGKKKRKRNVEKWGFIDNGLNKPSCLKFIGEIEATCRTMQASHIVRAGIKSSLFDT